MKNMIKKLFCKIGWHSFSYNTVEYDTPFGKQTRNKCKWCGIAKAIYFKN